MDVDSFLTSHSAAELQMVVDEAAMGVGYLYDRIAQQTIGAQGAGEQLITHRDLHKFKSQIIELANSSYIPPTDRELLFGWFANTTGEKITKETIKEEADKLKAIENASRQLNQTKALLSEAFSLTNSNTPDGAAKALQLLQ